MLNPELEAGDEIILLHMEDESMLPGTKGTVTKVQKDPFESGDEKLISVKWENGRTLNLLSTVDVWKKVEKKDIKESRQDEFFLSNVELLKYFNTKFLVDYLLKVKESGIVNMFGSAPYLYLGKERIEHEFHYHEFNNEESEEKFQEVLDLANEAQSIMITGTMKMLESQNKELSLVAINSALQRNANKIVQWYINVLS